MQIYLPSNCKDHGGGVTTPLVVDFERLHEIYLLYFLDGSFEVTTVLLQSYIAPRLFQLIGLLTALVYLAATYCERRPCSVQYSVAFKKLLEMRGIVCFTVAESQEPVLIKGDFSSKCSQADRDILLEGQIQTHPCAELNQ